MQPGFDYYEQKPVKAGMDPNMLHQRNGSFANGSRNNDFASPMNGGASSNYMPNGSMGNQSQNGMPNMNSSVNDLDQLRQESKLRLKAGVPYQPNENSTQTNSRSAPGYKDISYYTGSGIKHN